MLFLEKKILPCLFFSKKGRMCLQTEVPKHAERHHVVYFVSVKLTFGIKESQGMLRESELSGSNATVEAFGKVG